MSKKTLIPIGPYHPLQEEPELFKLYCDGEIVKDIKWETGYNHRGIEKLVNQKLMNRYFSLLNVFAVSAQPHIRLLLQMQLKRLLRLK